MKKDQKKFDEIIVILSRAPIVKYSCRLRKKPCFLERNEGKTFIRISIYISLNMDYAVPLFQKVKVVANYIGSDTTSNVGQE